MEFSQRYYQERAADEIISALKMPGNDLISLPTGSGKSVVIANVARRINEMHWLNRNILILQPSKEILKQNLSKLSVYVGEDSIGVYSASYGRKDIAQFTFATIGSIYKAPNLFKRFGIVIIDEAHLVNMKEECTMYMSFLEALGQPKTIGLSATIYRTEPSYKLVEGTWQEGKIECISILKLINRMEPTFWDRLLYNVDIGELIDKGYLAPFQYIKMPFYRGHEQTLKVIQSVKDAECHYKSILVFCSSVNEAQYMSSKVPNSECVSSKTKAEERDQIIEGFKLGIVKTVFNYGVLSIGFDHPALDCIVFGRRVGSIGLYYQMGGRGARRALGKRCCTIIDFGGNVQNFGRIEGIKIVRTTEDQWDLKTDTGMWHGRQMGSYIVEKKRKKR